MLKSQKDPQSEVKIRNLPLCRLTVTVNLKAMGDSLFPELEGAFNNNSNTWVSYSSDKFHLTEGSDPN